MDYEREELIRHINEAGDGYCHCQKCCCSTIKPFYDGVQEIVDKLETFKKVLEHRVVFKGELIKIVENVSKEDWEMIKKWIQKAKK